MLQFSTGWGCHMSPTRGRNRGYQLSANATPQPPIAQKGAEQHWAKRRMSVASQLEAWCDSWGHEPASTYAGSLRNWDSSGAFVISAGSTCLSAANFWNLFKLLLMLHPWHHIPQLITQDPDLNLPPGTSTCSRQTSALKRRWFASSSSLGCAGSTSKASWRFIPRPGVMLWFVDDLLWWTMIQ